MKTKILYTIFLLVSILTLNLKAQAIQEELRAKFLSNYYSEYHNKANTDNDPKTIDSNNTINKMDNNSKQYQHTDSLVELRKIKANCLNSLQNQNKGVAESAIFVSMQFKNKFPNENVSSLIDALSDIAKEYDNTLMSYKAQLAKMYINNTNWFENIKVNSIEDQQNIYTEIAQTINGRMFTKEL